MRHVVLVAGSGRSGTSLMARTLGALGCLVPQPEVEPDETNPQGFGESRWVVDLHARMLKEAGVRIADADPAAVARVQSLRHRDRHAETLRGWLSGQLEVADRIVVKDPRMLWFVPLWEQVGRELGAEVGVVTMLRHPAEVVRSKLDWYGHVPDNEASSLAGWVNSMLEVEARTRHLPRCYVRFADLQGDWEREVRRVADALGVPGLAADVDARRAEVDALYDRSLYRSRADWGDLGVLTDLRDLAAELWRTLDGLVDEPAAGSGSGVPDRLEEHRRRYDSLHAQMAAVVRGAGSADRELRQEVRRLERRLARTRARLRATRARLRELEERADRPGGLRSRVPARLRRALRRG